MSVKKFDDLKLIPPSLMKSQDFLAKAIWTVIKHMDRLHYSKVTDEFYKASGFKIQDFFDFTEKDMEQYFKMKRHMFFIDDKGYVKTKDFVDGSDQKSLTGN